MSIPLLAVLMLVSTVPMTRDTLPGASVVQRMHAAHRSHWYRTLAMDKRATFTSTDGRRTRDDAWVDLVQPPGRRRLDLAPLDSGDATLFVRDSLFDIRRGAVARTMSFTHLLSVLLHDIHVQPPSVTLRQLEAAGVDLGRLRRDAWQGRPTLVVGARDASDRDSPQFWVDAERLVLVRLVEPRDAERRTVQETVLENYRRLGRAWYPARIVYLRNGHRFLTECVQHADTAVALPDSAWRPQPWLVAPWRPRAAAAAPC